MAGLLLIFITTCVYMLIRNRWVYNRRIRWINFVRDYQIKLIKDGDYKNLYKYSFDDLIEATAPYLEMYLQFWEWRVSRFIKDRELFDLVMGVEKTEEVK